MTANHDDANHDQRPAVLIVTELYPNVTNSFLGTFVVRQLRHLQDRYHLVVITTHVIPLAKIFALRQPSFRQDNGLDVYSLRYYPWWLSVLVLLKIVNNQRSAAINKRYIAKKIQKLAQTLHARYHFELVHGHEIYIGDEAVPIGTALGIPSVFTLHGLYTYHLKGFGPKVMSMVIDNLKSVKTMIAVSWIAARTYIDQGIPKSSVQIIPNGIEMMDAPPPHQEIRSRANGRIVLLTVGFFTAEKRINQVIETVEYLRSKEHQSILLVIVGRGERESELRQLVQTLHLDDQVLFLGEIAPANMPTVYAAADIVVHPSVVDSFSMVGLEAMSFGKPLICTSAIGLTEYGKSGQDMVVVPPDNQAALNAAVEELVSNPARRQSIGQAGQTTARTLSAQAVADKVATVYESLRHAQ